MPGRRRFGVSLPAINHAYDCTTARSDEEDSSYTLRGLAARRCTHPSRVPALRCYWTTIVPVMP
jgi:hypothetical protein